MADTILYQGTRDYAIPAHSIHFCSDCGEPKNRDAERCLDCHLKKVHDIVKVRAIAKQRLAAFMAYYRRKKKCL